MRMTTYKCLVLLFCMSFVLPGIAQSGSPCAGEGQDDCFGAVIYDSVPVYKEPNSASDLVRNATWMEGFFVTDAKMDENDIEFYQLMEEDDKGNLNLVGWTQSNFVLIQRKPLKEEGISKKALMVVSFDKKNSEIKGATVRVSPEETAPSNGPDLTLFEIYFVYQEFDNRKEKKTYFLVGRSEQIIYSPEDVILGWVEKDQVFEWDTRYAAEYDKTTLGSRDSAAVFEKYVEWQDVLSGKVDRSDIDALAIEDKGDTEILHSDPRFPIIDSDKEISDHQVWRVGFVADQILENVASNAEYEEVKRITRMPNSIDVLIVYDGTGSMKSFKDSVKGAIAEVKKAAVNAWLNRHQGELAPVIRVSIAMYKDYEESDFFVRLPLDNHEDAAINRFIDSYDFTGGSNKPAVFNGIIEAVNKASNEFDKNSIRLVALIGDMGNLGESLDSDKNNHTIEKVIRTLKGINADFYGIHINSENDSAAFVKFKLLTKDVEASMVQGTVAYLPVSLDTAKTQAAIYSNILKVTEERFSTTDLLRSIGQGRTVLGKNMTGTIIEKRAIDIMVQNGLDPEKFAVQGVNPFGRGWVLPNDPKTNKRNFKKVVLLSRDEVEFLIATLGQMVDVDIKTIETGWKQALQEVTGDNFTVNETDSVAGIMKAYMGLPVKSAILNMSFDEIGQLSLKERRKYMLEFKQKLFKLRAVVNEQRIEINNADSLDMMSFNDLGSKLYWFGDNNSLKVWLDADKYIP